MEDAYIYLLNMLEFFLHDLGGNEEMAHPTEIDYHRP